MEMKQNDGLEPVAPVKKTYTRAQKLLLLGVLAIGLCWDYGWHHGQDWLYGLFWVIYLAVFYAFNWAALKTNRLTWALAVPAVALCIRFGSCGWEPTLYSLNLVAIPLLLMTHAVFASSDIPKRQEGAAVPLVLKGFFVKPFTAIPDAFRAVAAVFSRRGEGRIKKVLLGLALGLPLAAAVLALLISADAMMKRLLGDLFTDAPVGTIILRTLNVLLAATLFYSFLYNMIWGKRETVPEKPAREGAQTAAVVVLSMLLIVYAVFGYVQFRYLFGGQLPQELTYSEYARQGFSELIVVALINFSVYTAINALCREGGALRVMATLLLGATAMLLASAMTRLLLYIGAYGLTMLRILPLWLMLWLCALTVLGVVRLYKKDTPMLRIAALSLVYWFTLLNLPDWNALISMLNARYF